MPLSSMVRFSGVSCGFGMIAGPQFSPQLYRNTAIEATASIVGLGAGGETRRVRDPLRGRRAHEEMLTPPLPDRNHRIQRLRNQSIPTGSTTMEAVAARKRPSPIASARAFPTR